MHQFPGPALDSQTARFKWPEISGQYSCMPITHMTLKIRGMVFSAAAFLCRWVLLIHNHILYTNWFSWKRRTNTFSHLRVPWIRNPKQPVLEMPISMACVQRQRRLSHMSQHRYAWGWILSPSSDMWAFGIGPLCINFGSGIFAHWPCHRFTALLYDYSGVAWWPTGERQSRPADDVVELVSCHRNRWCCF